MPLNMRKNNNCFVSKYRKNNENGRKSLCQLHNSFIAYQVTGLPQTGTNINSAIRIARDFVEAVQPP